MGGYQDTSLSNGGRATCPVVANYIKHKFFSGLGCWELGKTWLSPEQTGHWYGDLWARLQVGRSPAGWLWRPQPRSQRSRALHARARILGLLWGKWLSTFAVVVIIIHQNAILLTDEIFATFCTMNYFDNFRYNQLKTFRQHVNNCGGFFSTWSKVNSAISSLIGQ